MIVCHCHCVTDREIRALAHAGVRSVDGVSRMCGAGSGCGGCRELITELVRKEHPSKPPSSPSPSIMHSTESAA
jgi:bacterioferritin-associated ferredoxin